MCVLCKEQPDEYIDSPFALLLNQFNNNFSLSLSLQQEFQQLKLYKDAELFHDLQLPPPSALRVFVNLEIVAARNFTYDSLFVTYVVDLPENWTASDAKCLRGRTQRCTMKRGTANFSYIAEFVVDIDLDKSADDDNVQFAWPRLLLSARSLDAWTR